MISQNDWMTKRSMERAQGEQAQFDDYVNETAGGRGAAAETAV
jgi:hypothetical protein